MTYSQSSSLKLNRWQANKHVSQLAEMYTQVCVNCVLIGMSTITWPIYNGSLINVWILPPTVNDENDINNQLVGVQC